MKKFFFSMSACLLVMGFVLIPDGTPAETVKEWLGYEVVALSALYLIFHLLEAKGNKPA